MSKDSLGGESLWQARPGAASYPPLDRDLAVDVVVIGAGITGLTAATLLKRAGKTVAVLELHRVAGGETGHTTAHLTEVVDTRYHVHASRWGEAVAREVAASSRAANGLIEELARGTSCGFARVPGFLYAETAAQAKELEKEVHAARLAGLDATLTREVPLPFEVTLAMRVEDQAQLHPREYLLPLAAALPGGGCFLFEHTRVLEVRDGDPCVVVCDGGHRLHAKEVLVATNVPVVNRLSLHTKVFPYRTYAIAGPADRLPAPGLYWDLDDPYHYTRTHPTPAGPWLVVGGEDHKTGTEEDTEGRYLRLEAYARERFGLSRVAYRWSGQVIEPVDGLPFIGRNAGERHVQVATGFSGNGMTFGTLAAQLMVDGVLGQKNPWATLYEATRVKSLASPGVLKELVTENLDFPSHFVGDRFAKAEVPSVREVPAGEGRLVSLGGRKKAAVYRDAQGRVHALSPVCTHLGCHVHWNTAEKSWDCPCHGGRFDAEGRVLNGPAVANLAPVQLEDEDSATERP